MMNGRIWSNAAGYTLVEMMVSLAILLLVIASVTSVMLFGEAGSKISTGFTDQAQQLRVAMNQIAEDFAYARRGTASSNQFSIKVMQPLVSRTADFGYDWSAVSSDWPGDLREWPELTLTYTLQAGVLIRKVEWDGKVYNQQVLTSGLDASSSIKPDALNPQLIKVYLSLPPEGGGRRAEVYAEFFAR